MPLRLEDGDVLCTLDVTELGADSRLDAERDDLSRWLDELLSDRLLDESLGFGNEELDGLRESDDPDELGRELLPSELAGKLFGDVSEELIERDRLLESELRRLLLFFDELIIDLEPLLSDDSLGELGDDRDDSLTLENDLLDP